MRNVPKTGKIVPFRELSLRWLLKGLKLRKNLVTRNCSSLKVLKNVRDTTCLSSKVGSLEDKHHNKINGICKNRELRGRSRCQKIVNKIIKACNLF